MRPLRNLFLTVLAAALIACVPFAVEAGGKKLSGDIKCDGSSTVGPITEKMASAFKKLHPKVSISVGIAGTGGGFKKFAVGETDLSNASRKIKDTEAAKCKENGIEFLELEVAIDGLAVIIDKGNTWARDMTLEQLKKIWHPDIAAKKWSDVDPNWPNEKIELFGAGTNSGTFDYFTEAVNGKEKVSRTDYTPSEDDNTTLKGVIGNKYAMGYLGLSYYESNKGQLTAVSLAKKPGDPYIFPAPTAVLTYKYPLSRPLFIYVKKASLKQEHIREFIDFYLRKPEIVKDVGYVPLSPITQLKTRQKFEAFVKGL
jgi:phosphate transport system substrate-binding protein